MHHPCFTCLTFVKLLNDGCDCNPDFSVFLHVFWFNETKIGVIFCVVPISFKLFAKICFSQFCHILPYKLWMPNWYFESRCMIYSYFDFSLKNSSFRLPCQRPSSSADCARELFKGSNGLASLLDCTRKKIFWFGDVDFCDWRHKWSNFGAILVHVAWPRAQPLGQSVSLKFSLETRLESESFEPLIDFLAFLDHKLWSKINKLINYLISQIFLLT